MLTNVQCTVIIVVIVIWSLFSLGPTSYSSRVSTMTQKTSPSSEISTTWMIKLVSSHNRIDIIRSLMTLLCDKQSYGSDVVALEVWLNFPLNNSSYKGVNSVVSNSFWPYGAKVVHQRTVHRHTLGMWMDAWVPRHTTERVILLSGEDDSAPKDFYSRVSTAYELYAHIPHVFGIVLRSSLDRSLSSKPVMSPSMSLHDKHIFALTPTRWMAFLKWYYHRHLSSPEWRSANYSTYDDFVGLMNEFMLEYSLLIVYAGNGKEWPTKLSTAHGDDTIVDVRVYPPIGSRGIVQPRVHTGVRKGHKGRKDHKGRGHKGRKGKGGRRNRKYHRKKGRRRRWRHHRQSAQNVDAAQDKRTSSLYAVEYLANEKNE